MKKLLILFMLILTNSSVFAHSQLTEILPKDNVTYNDVPPHIEMKFKSEVKIVRIEMMRVDNKEKIALDTNSVQNGSIQTQNLRNQGLHFSDVRKNPGFVQDRPPSTPFAIIWPR